MPLPLPLREDERAALKAGQGRSAQVRPWRRYQAVLLRAEGVPVAAGARDLGGSEASVTNWTTAWRTEGLAGVAEGVHAGATRRLAPEAVHGGVDLTQGDGEE